MGRRKRKVPTPSSSDAEEGLVRKNSKTVPSTSRPAEILSTPLAIPEPAPTSSPSLMPSSIPANQADATSGGPTASLDRPLLPTLTGATTSTVVPLSSMPPASTSFPPISSSDFPSSSAQRSPSSLAPPTAQPSGSASGPGGSFKEWLQEQTLAGNDFLNQGTPALIGQLLQHGVQSVMLGYASATRLKSLGAQLATSRESIRKLKADREIIEKELQAQADHLKERAIKARAREDDLKRKETEMAAKEEQAAQLEKDLHEQLESVHRLVEDARKETEEAKNEVASVQQELEEARTNAAEQIRTKDQSISALTEEVKKANEARDNAVQLFQESDAFHKAVERRVEEVVEKKVVEELEKSTDLPFKMGYHHCLKEIAEAYPDLQLSNFHSGFSGQLRIQPHRKEMSGQKD